jgi:hypothetical protein
MESILNYYNKQYFSWARIQLSVSIRQVQTCQACIIDIELMGMCYAVSAGLAGLGSFHVA